MTKYEPNIWHGWNGGACPVHPETIVDARTLCAGMVFGAKACCLGWCSFDDSDFNIIAFRIIKEHKEPREVWMRRTNMLCEWSACNRDDLGAVLFREVLE